MPGPADQPDQTLRSADTHAPNGRTVGRQLALRPEFSAHARMPSTTLPCATVREAGLLVLAAGPVALPLRALPHRPGGFVPTDQRRGVDAVFLPPRPK